MKIRELAKRLGLSPATISRALSADQAHLVAEPVRRRIQLAAEKWNYQPNQLARNLAKGRSQTIAVVLYYVFDSPFFDDYLAKVQRGVYVALEHYPAYGCKMMLLPKGKSLSEVDHHIIGSGVDGILISTICDYNAPFIQELALSVEKRWRRPMVAINMEPRAESRINTVSFSNSEGAYRATAHLLQRRHRSIGLISLEDSSPDLAERRDGFQRALADHHAAFDARHVVVGDSTVEGGYRAAIQLFNRPQSAKVSAIFCMNDEMAFGALRALRALGKRCPQDIALMGFDGLPIGDYTTPSLSTVLQPSFEMAKVGTQLLMDLINNPRKTPTHVRLESRLLLRESA